jgi:hypothetical protein
MSTPKPAPQRNRQPTPAERIGLTAQIERDSKLLDYLKDDLAARLTIQTETAVSLKKAVTTLSEAELRLKSTTAQRDSLVIGLRNLSSIPKTVKTEPDGPAPQSSQTESQSSHTAATAAAIVRHQGTISLLEGALENAQQDVRDASEAVIISQEDLKAATTLHDASGSLIASIRAKIRGIDEVICRHKQRIHPIWKIPNNVWAEIFSLVARFNEESPKIFPHTIASMVLSEVCFH